MTMRYRSLGRSGLPVSELGYGAWGIGQSHWIGADDRESLAALGEAIELGVNFIDTALLYGEGHSETLVGRAVRAAKETGYVATKIPPANARWPAESGDPVEDAFPAAWIRESTERSLAHLGLETIDLQQFHTWTDDWVHQGGWAQEVAALKQAGKIRCFGVSIRNHRPASVLKLVRSGLIDSVQVVYNIFDQSPEEELFPATIEHGVGVIARVPFDESGLTGRIRPDTTFADGDFRNSYFAGERKLETYERAQAIVRELAIGEESLAAVALRFCLSHPAVSTVIPGMRSSANVVRNVAAAAEPPLDEREFAILRRHDWPRER